MARFTTTGGSGDGTPGPQGPAGSNGSNGTNGADGKDSLFLGTWNSETEFLAVYQGGPVGLADGDWWAFVKDNSNPNKIYVVREDPNSATGWVIDDNESFVLPQGEEGPAGDPFGIYYLGDYVSTNGYVTDIAVVRGSDGQLYLAKASGQLGDPINYQSNGQWEVWIPKGADGSDGAPGADGQDGAPGADGLDGADGETPFTLVGAYDNGVSYNLGVAVYYNGGTYVRTGNPLNPGYPPEPGTINASWTPIADKGEQGDTGAQGAPGADGDPLDFLNVASNIVPTTTNFYTLGTVDHRWADVYLGPNTINIIDQSLGTNATMGIDNGIFFINGIAQAQLPNVKITNLTFNDNTTQTTAAVAQVNSDWNATTGKAQILNKPSIPAAQVNADWNSVSGVSQILNKPDLSSITATLTSYASTLSSPNLAYSGTPTTAVYIATGKMVYVQIDVNLATVTNFGTNGQQYLLTLPFTAAHDSLLIGQCKIGAIVYEIAGKVTAGSNSIGLEYSLSNGNNTPNTFEIFTKQHPANMTTATTFQISGMFISQ